jgi:serine/threonine-protein kinase
MGQSGLGVAYQAWHPDTGRLAMLKQVLPIAQSSRAETVLFMRDLYLIDMLHCDCLVRLYEAGLHYRQPFFISEFLPGGSLDQFVSTEGKPQLAPRQAAEVVIGALDSLVQMHARGDVHRGLKPENIVIRDLTSRPKLADFGLANSYEKHGGTITRTGEYADAIMYMPPEQIRSFQRARPFVDVYAMGVILYYLLTGHYPLDFPNPAEVRAGARLTKDPARMILEDPPRPVGERRSDLPPALCAVVDQAVHKEPGERFASALEFQAALRRALTDL